MFFIGNCGKNSDQAGTQLSYLEYHVRGLEGTRFSAVLRPSGLLSSWNQPNFDRGFFIGLKADLGGFGSILTQDFGTTAKWPHVAEKR